MKDISFNNFYKPVVIGIGEVLWDIFPEGKELGGAPANFIYFAKQFGAESYIISTVGKDVPGNEILAKLNSFGLNTYYVSVNNEHLTGVVDIILDDTGNPDFKIQKNVAWDYINWSEDIKNIAEVADAVCFGTLAQRSKVSRDTIRKFLHSTRDECLIILDLNLRQSFYNKEIIETSLEYADILKLNDEEFNAVTEMFCVSGSEPEVLSELLNNFNLQLIALTKGENGSILYSRKGESFKKIPVDNIVDTVGAGDSFTSVLVMGLLNNIPLKDIHKKAAEVSAFVCSREGAMPEMPENLISRKE